MIKVNVAEIKKNLVGTKQLSYEATPAELGISPEEVRVEGTVKFTGTITNTGDVLLLQGKVQALVNRICGRCLQEFSRTSTAEVLERYYPVGKEEETADGFAYSGDLVDIGPAIRECLVLAEPLKVLCKEDCKGLCPKCGTNLNLHSCNCDRTHYNPKFSALQKLLQK